MVSFVTQTSWNARIMFEMQCDDPQTKYLCLVKFMLLALNDLNKLDILTVL